MGLAARVAIGMGLGAAVELQPQMSAQTPKVHRVLIGFSIERRLS